MHLTGSLLSHPAGVENPRRCGSTFFTRMCYSYLPMRRLGAASVCLSGSLLTYCISVCSLAHTLLPHLRHRDHVQWCVAYCIHGSAMASQARTLLDRKSVV